MLTKAKAKVLSWADINKLDDEQLEELLYGPRHAGRAGRPEPDCAYLHTELRRNGVTLELLHLEYLEQHPDDGYRYSAFCQRYKDAGMKCCQPVQVIQSLVGGGLADVVVHQDGVLVSLLVLRRTTYPSLPHLRYTRSPAKGAITMDPQVLDHRIRLAAFRFLERCMAQHGDAVRSHVLGSGVRV